MPASSENKWKKVDVNVDPVRKIIKRIAVVLLKFWPTKLQKKLQRGENSSE